ncbi:hypothetical protein HYN59_09120 [Flavobacterium album]|uniref:ParB-like N-terminal domain-containing protein n=1 Tax=Flavobacterium album TaxID=2175091 RepID=A0A2S1QXZ7_9FLAO|nr:ParB/RepB/Spo0J family partition protein [Flavobacterium album]AWH85268.1 hypothetical protein HYN59_09120 [Flavobacterium album]
MRAISDNLKQVETSKIEFDKDNPRRESEAQIKSQPSFRNLVSSVRDDGIIVPLIVKAKDKGFVLIDGERRLRAAIEVNLSKIPVLVAKDHIDGKILAYKTHKLHEKWSTVAETTSIKHIVDELKKQDPDVTDTVLKKKIIEITHENNTKAGDMLEIIKFEDKYIERAMTNDLSHSYLVQIGKSFINKIKKEHPNILKLYTEDQLRSIMAEKALKGLLGNTRFLMDNFKELFNDVSNKTEVEKIIIKFLNNKARDIRSAHEEYLNYLTKLEKAGRNINPKKESKKSGVTKDSKNISKNRSAKSETNNQKRLGLTKKQQTLLSDVRTKYEVIAKTFSSDEEEYLLEALHCLEEHCFKGATLMIWAAGISRILAYIEKDINDFNDKSKEMVAQKTSYYKHFSSQFRTEFKIIDEIRQNSRDMQLLCYICYKGFITEPSFKKLKGHYDKRNDCAHPTSITLGVNETVAIFEDVFELILDNKKLATIIDKCK